MQKICNYFIDNHQESLDQYNRSEKGFIFQFKKLPIVKKFILPQEGEELQIS
jgi:hypothetical protein